MRKKFKKLLAKEKKLLTFATLFGRNGDKKLEIDNKEIVIQQALEMTGDKFFEVM